ncbi:MAG: PIG-L family deacetylase [Ferruginibacter sp.]
MQRIFTALLFTFFIYCAKAQPPKTYTSSEILLQIKKLDVLGAVLYVAAHPDDENTRLLAYLANEKLYRTGYLSLTRGDGGQNLIGDEQGVDLGLIRTQELLAARRTDGAEQFFSRAYDFGFSKSSEEALSTWGHDKILSDVVWVIRKFRPDVVIARFPEDSRAGHGHHAASGILAREAYDAAADPQKFPEQLAQGVTVWQVKRMLWNTYNFGSGNTQSDEQFKVDVGMYNPLLGKGYGEISALSRSQHKSQGFGVPAQRGSVLEYFQTIKGDKPVNDLMDGVDISWEREGQKEIHAMVQQIIAGYNLQHPAASIKPLLQLYNTVQQQKDSYWKLQKLKEIQNIIESCSGLFLEASTTSQYAVQGDSLKVNVFANNRTGAAVAGITVNVFDQPVLLDSLKNNVTKSKTVSLFIKQDEKLTQPYWLENPMNKGSFNVTDQQLIGKAENDPVSAVFKVNIEGTDFTFVKPIRYKFTDPVKGEIYQPVNIVPPFTIKVEPELLLPGHNDFSVSIYPNKDDPSADITAETSEGDKAFWLQKVTKDVVVKKSFNSNSLVFQRDSMGVRKKLGNLSGFKFYTGRFIKLKEQKNINYDHIPHQVYFREPQLNSLSFDLKISGKKIGYITGAGDKVPQAIEQMGYKVSLLKEADISIGNLQQFDAVVTGVRAYNTNDWMSNVYDALMQYVKEGGVLLVQYNTNNFISSVKSKIGPYDFSISRNRITDEYAKVNFLVPNHPVLNYPNKITEKDFDGWIQERSIYHAEKIDSNYQRIVSMKDPGESEQDGSLIVANYGKGRFVYTGLVFFRQLPAGVPGAYRLFANLIAAYPDPSSNLDKLRQPKFQPKGKKG